jgi:diacylglycerol kinase family enzyme
MATKFDFIINRRSGTVLHVGEDKVRQELENIFGDQAGEIRFVTGGDIAPTVKAWAKDSADEGRGLIIGGGDGSVLTAATEVLGRDDIALGVLPLGTHNLFARQLGFAADFREAAAQYRDSTPAAIDVGSVNGQYFLCGLMLDRNSVNFYEAREHARDKKIIAALKKMFSVISNLAGRDKVHLDVSNEGQDSTEHKGKIFVVTNNELAPRGQGLKFRTPKMVVEDALAKNSQSDGKLAFYAISSGPVDLAFIMAGLVDGSWTKKKCVSTQVAPELLIKSSVQGDIQIVLDGEITKTSFPLDVKIIPQGLKVYKPTSP